MENEVEFAFLGWMIRTNIVNKVIEFRLLLLSSRLDRGRVGEL